MKRRTVLLLCRGTLIVMMLLAVFQPSLRVFGSGDAAVMNRRALTIGQQNIVKRAYQMTNISWTPQRDIVGWNSELVYQAGTTYTGLPYGQPVFASYVPWSTGLDGFLEAVNDPTGKMYTSHSSYNSRAPYYSTDCSAFVSWAWDLGSRQTTSTLRSFATQISTTAFENAQVGDCLCLAGSHVVLITDITYDDHGAINSIEISESTVSSVHYCCHQVRYGTGGAYTLENLSKKYFDKGYILYRCKTRENVTYQHSCAVALDGDVCDACGVGEPKEIPTDLVVVSTEDIVLYASPATDADQLGTIFAGNQITVVACFQDDAGVLWYKTADHEWLPAAKTRPGCNHQYTFTVIAPPLCNGEGMAAYICSFCGDRDTQTLPATGHRYEDGVCQNCGAKDLEIRKGDIWEDGDITAADTVLLARYLTGLQSFSQIQLQAADINDDGEVTAADTVRLARYVAGVNELL